MWENEQKTEYSWRNQAFHMLTNPLEWSRKGEDDFTVIQSRSFEELKPQVMYCETQLLILQFETTSIISW
jgi:hypothetical protein